ncbi:MAG TPA: hypothetical protein VII08_00555 [Myxococcales bacterium]|jgi:oxygen-independent coproporphyrinogen III oxidase
MRPLATERGFDCSADDVRRPAIITQIMCNFHVDLGARAEQEFAGESWKRKASFRCAVRRSN